MHRHETGELFERFLSCYLEKIKLNNSCVALLHKFNSELTDEISFRQFADTDAHMTPFQMDSHWRVQQKQVFCGDITFDFIGRFERFDSDFDYVKQKIGLASQASPSRDSHKVSAFTQMDSYYDAGLIDKVLEIYRDDFAIFNYSKKLEI